MIGLTQEQVRTFNEEGMLCIPDFLSPQEVSQMMVSAQTLLTNLELDKHPKTQFKTKENEHVGDQYFLDSSDKVSYFFDTDAFDANGQLRYPKERAVNKIGHGLHMHNDVFREITFKEQIKQIPRDLQYKDPRVLQSMIIFKNSTGGKDGSEKQKMDVGGEGRENNVPAHNDGTFLYTSPQSALGFWFALEDCTAENGCLSFHPGSHKTFPINKRFVRIEGGAKGCNMIDLDIDKPMPEDNLEKYRFVECKAGSLVLIHNSVLHKLEKNALGKSRFAYAFHLIDGTAEYDELNWLQVPSTGGADFLKLYDGN